MHMLRQLATDDETLKEDIAALGPWFHNLRLTGCRRLLTISWATIQR